jgi:hypothetical protein
MTALGRLLQFSVVSRPRTSMLQCKSWEPGLAPTFSMALRHRPMMLRWMRQESTTISQPSQTWYVHSEHLIRFVFGVYCT